MMLEPFKTQIRQVGNSPIVTIKQFFYKEKGLEMKHEVYAYISKKPFKVIEMDDKEFKAFNDEVMKQTIKALNKLEKRK